MYVKKIKNCIKNDNRGISSIELTIGVLISIVLFAGFLDFIIISNKMQALSTVNTYIARIVSNQGCVAPSANSCGTDYNTDYIKNKQFISSSELYNQVNKIMKSEGISSSDWKVKIDNKTLNANTTTRLFNFREMIDINIEVYYKWGNLSNFLPVGTGNKKFTSHQRIVSTYQIRNEDEEIGFDYNG